MFEDGKVEGLFDGNMLKLGGMFSCKSTSEAADSDEEKALDTFQNLGNLRGDKGQMVM